MLTFSPYRHAANRQAMRDTSPRTGYKLRSHRLAEAIGMRWVNRASAYLGSPTQCDRLARLHAAGWDAHTLIWQAQEFPAPPEHVAALPEPWMRRRPGLWIAPLTPLTH